MTQQTLIAAAPLFVALIWAAVQDLHSRRIPNVLTFGLILTGFAQSFCTAGTVSPMQALAQGRLNVLLRNTAVVGKNVAHLRDFGVDHVKATGKACRSVNRPLPYAVPVLLATILVAYATFSGR